MATVTRTFSTRLLPAYIANATIEIAHFRDMTFEADELTAFYLDSAIAIVDVGSFNIGKIAEIDGEETDIEKSLAILKAESLSNRIGLKFLTRKNNTGIWEEVAEFILINYGRKDYLDLRGRLGFPSRVMERNDAIAVQLVDYGDGLLWDTDFIKIDFGCTVEIEKKNNVDALIARINALELALDGKLTNLPSETLLGRNIGVGTVEILTKANLLQNSYLLLSRTGSIPFNANTWWPSSFAAARWLDNNAGHLNLPGSVTFGMILQLDPLFGTDIAGRYRVQTFSAGSRNWDRIETNAVWGIWRERTYAT